MKKKIIGIFICTLLIATALPALGTMNRTTSITCINKNIDFQPCQKDGVDQEQTDHCNRGFGLRPSEWYAQGFKPTMKKLTSVQLRMFKNGNPPDGLEITVSIREDLIGKDLTSTSEDADQIGYDNWVKFDFPDITVIPEKTYYIVCRCNGGHDLHVYAWLYDKGNPYERGDTWGSIDSGISWDDLWSDYASDPDFCFRTYGNKKSKPNKPLIYGPTIGKTGNEYGFNNPSTDPEEDEISYHIEIGDEFNTYGTRKLPSGEDYKITHILVEEGNYEIQVKTKDNYDFDSGCSTLEVAMPKNKPINTPFLNFLENHPNLFPLLRQRLGL